MTSPHGRVTIIMPTHDRPVLLRRAVADVAAQDSDEWRLVIVNGGEAGSVDALLAELDADLVARIDVLHRPGLAGRAAAINAGLAVSAGEFISIHPDDDTWDPRFLSVALAHLDAHAGHGAVITRGELVTEEIHGSHVVEVGREPNAPYLPAATLSALFGGTPFAPIQLLYRRSVQDELGSYREDVDAADMWEFVLRLARWFEIGLIDERLAFTHQRVDEPAARDEIGAQARLRNSYLKDYLADHPSGALIHLTHYLGVDVAELHRRGRVSEAHLERLERAAEQYGDLAERLDRLASRFDDISEHLGHIERLIVGSRERSDQRFDVVSEHLGHLERRIGDVENAIAQAGLTGTLRRKLNQFRGRES